MNEHFPNSRKESLAAKSARLARIGMAAIAINAAAPQNGSAPEGETSPVISTESLSPALTMMQVETDPVLKTQYEKGQRLYEGQAKYLKEQMLADPKLAALWEKYKANFESILQQTDRDENGTIQALTKLGQTYGSSPETLQAVNEFNNAHVREYFQALATYMAIHIDDTQKVWIPGTWGSCLVSHHKGE